METLRPVEVSEYYINRVASGMCRYFWDNIFKEIFDILKDNTVYNSKDDLINAIRNGSIWYENGAFRGKFTNGISKTLEDIGAKFSRNAYYIAKSQIPFEYVTVIDFVAAQATAKASRISNFLAGLGSILSQISLKQYIEATVDLMYRKLEVDILKSAQEKKVPVIELGIVQPKVKLPKAQTKNLEKYWKEQDKKAEKINKDLEKAREERDKAQKEANRKTKDKNGKREDKTEEEKAADQKKLDDAKAKVGDLNNKLADQNKEAFQNAPQVEFKLDDIALDEKSKKIAQDYTYNMEFWVKKWEAKNIVIMRQDILKMISEGARTPRIQEYFEKRWGIAKNKAKFLAENESHLAASVIKATEYQALGCTKFKWGRSTSKEKRELHKTYYGKIFNFDEPPVIDERLGIKGLPRQIWNCLPAKEPIVSPFFYKRIYRRWYTGELTTLVTNTGYSLNTTPNHPILTDKGWIGAGAIKVGDKIAKIKDDFVFSTSKNPQHPVTTIDQLFDFFSVFLNPERVTTAAGDFHGDGIINEQVEIIDVKSNLFFDTKTVLDKDIINIIFSKAEDAIVGFNFPKSSSFFKSLNIGGFIPEGIISFFDKLLTLINSEFTHSNQGSLTTIAGIYTQFLKMIGNSASCDFEMFCKSLHTPPFDKQTLYRFIWELFKLVSNSFMTDESMPVFTHSGRKISAITADLLGDFSQIQTFDIEFDTVVDKISSEFNDHIYNLENSNNWYLYHNYIIKNCKCQMLIVPPTLSELLNKTEEVRNAKRNIFKRIFNSTQRNNNAWRYRRFGQGQAF